MKQCDDVSAADVQAVRELRNGARVEAHVARVSEQEQQAAARYDQRVKMQAARTCDARQRDKETQQRKLQAAEMAEQQQVIWRAQALQ